MASAVGNGGPTLIMHDSEGSKDRSDGEQNSAALKHRLSIVPTGLSRKLSMSGNGFQLIVHISNAENGVGIAFKQDGQRFDTSQRTFKFFSGMNYKCTFKCKPPIEFHNLHLGGSDLELISTSPGSGEYTTIWNTTGIDPTRKGAREDLLFILSGPDGNLRHKLQTKFYALEDKHGEYGHKLDSLIWLCEIDLASGTITIANEQVL